MTVVRVARRLRESGRGLWPNPGKGYSKPRLEPIHAANLLLAFTCGAPVDAARTATCYGALHCKMLFRTLFDAERRPIEESQQPATPEITYLGSDRVPVYPALDATLTALIETFIEPVPETSPFFEVLLAIDEQEPRANLIVGDNAGEYRALFLPSDVDPYAVLGREAAISRSG